MIQQNYDRDLNRLDLFYEDIPIVNSHVVLKISIKPDFT